MGDSVSELGGSTFERRRGMLPAVSEFRYAQFCPLARAAEVLGSRWSLLVLRELMLGPQRFGELRRRLAGISTSVLAERLAALEGYAVVEAADLPPPASVRVYRLTPQGEALRPVLSELARWGLFWLRPPAAGDHFEADWLRLALQAFAAPGPTPARRYELRVGGGRLRFEGGEHGLRFSADDAPAELEIEAGPDALIGLLSGRLPATARGLRLRGDASALADLPRLFRFESPSRAPTHDPSGSKENTT
jgi:DNA-binding HxlR family transcriptional regulator